MKSTERVARPTIYVVEWRDDIAGEWHVEYGPIAPAGFLESYGDALTRLYMYGDHATREYQLVPYVRTEL